MQLPDTVTLREMKPGFPVLEVSHDLCTGSVALLGAHVMEWIPAGQKPVLYMSADAVFEEGQPIRGGIPVCWPWFGGREGLPGHGFARLRFWELTRAVDSAEGVELEFHLRGSGDIGWPHAYALTLTVKMGKTLAISLEMTHLGESSVAITAALHTYLSVGAIEHTVVQGLEGTRYLDTLEDHQVKQQEGEVDFDREVDRIYDSEGAVQVVDKTWKRALDVGKSGSRATVVWNPWIEKSQRLADLPDDAYHGFLCIEAANTGEDLVVLKPQETHRISQVIAVRVSEPEGEG
jgi:glucose-6-phosphate 1-epimerase